VKYRKVEKSLGSTVKVEMKHVILEKARSHKYIRRLGTSGQYQYIYDDPEGRVIDKIEDIDSARPNDWIILYHGTTAEHARRIEKDGFHPDLEHNWNVKSKEGYTYFSYAYAPFYAGAAKSPAKERAIVKVKIQLKDLYPEDDFIMRGLGKPVYSQKELDAVDLGDYKQYTKRSLKALGNAAVKDPSNVKVLSVGYFDASRLLMVSDPSIIPINFMIMHQYYKDLSEHLATGGTIENAPREVFPGMEHIQGAEEPVKKGMKYVILQKARPHKYIRRLGSSGQYQYVYEESKGRKTYEETTPEGRMQLADWKDIKAQMKKNLDGIRTKEPKLHTIHPGPLSIENSRAIAGNMREELSSYTKYLAGDTVDLMHKLISLTEQLLEKNEGTSETMNQMCIDCVRKIVHQEVESNRRQFTDHGIRHIVKNILNQTEMFDTLEKQGMGVSSKDRLAAIFIMANHDIGYTTPLMRGGGTDAVKASKEHTAYSEKITGQQKDLWDVGKIFSSDEYDKILKVIRTHDSSELDPKDPVSTTTRIADNLSLFQQEKLPSMFRYVPGTEHILISMGLAAKKDDKEMFERSRNQLYHRVDEMSFSAALKRDLKSAVSDISFLTPKFTVGVLAGEMTKIESSDKGLISITIKHNPFDAMLQKLFDMGQRQVKKFLGDYGETDFTKENYLLGKYGDKAILELKVEK